MIDFIIDLSIAFSFLPVVPFVLWLVPVKRHYRFKWLFFSFISEQLLIQVLSLILLFNEMSNHLLLNIDSLMIHLLLGLFYLNSNFKFFLFTFCANIVLSIVFASYHGVQVLIPGLI